MRITVDASVDLDDVLEMVPDSAIEDVVAFRGARLVADFSSLSEDDRLEVERILRPKWHSVKACQAAYDKAMGRA